MTLEVFNAQLASLEAHWKGFYTNERKASLFRAVKHLPDHWIEACVKDFIWLRQAPGINQFLERAEQFEEDRLFKIALPSPAQVVPEKECANCSGCGYTTEDHNGVRAIKRCYCDVGRSKPATLLGPRQVVGGEREHVRVLDWGQYK